MNASSTQILVPKCHFFSTRNQGSLKKWLNSLGVGARKLENESDGARKLGNAQKMMENVKGHWKELSMAKSETV